MTAISLPRPLDRSEAFFWFLDHYSSMNFAVIAECDATFSGQALGAALAAAGQRHPLLNAGIDTVDGRLHFVPHAATGIPLEEIVAAEWREALAERIVRPFALGEAPLVRAVAIDDTRGGSVLALIFHHVVGDARSAFPVLAEVLEVLAGETIEPACEELLPPLSALYPPQLVGEAGRQVLENLKAARRAAFERLGPPAPQAGHRIDGGKLPRMIGLELSADETAALAERARAAGTTVNGLVGAAQLIALRERFGNDEERVLGLTCAADLRRYLLPPVAASTPGFYVTLVTMLQRVGGNDSLWPLATHLSEGIRQQLAAGVGHIFYDLMPPADQFPVSPEGISQFCTLMARGVQTSLLSNVGRLPPLPELPGIGVRARSFALCPTTTQPVFTAVATHERGMTLNLNYNAAQFGADDARAVAATLVGLLRGAAA